MSTPPNERNLWLPPSRMRRYQLAKAVGGLLFAMIFVGWMIIQWSNILMRNIAGILVAVTAWVTLRSIVVDIDRSRGRQLAIEPNRLIIITPGDDRLIELSDIARADWQNDPEPMMTLYAHDGSPLASLDRAFFADESEARTFLGWARRQTDLPFEVVWSRDGV